MKPDNETRDRYLARAKELRELARQLVDDESRGALIKAAEAYERMAEWDPTKRA